MQPEDVLTFWREAGPEKWFKKSDAFDAAIRERFGDAHAQAAAGELDGWAKTPGGALALIIVLDQFSRNLHRDDAAAFATDPHSLALTYEVIDRGWIDDLMAGDATRDIAVFALMPLMHSESIVDQQLGVARMLRPEWEGNFKFALVHRDIIARFGRFPHRNAVLGRRTTPVEQAFLDDGGFGG